MDKIIKSVNFGSISKTLATTKNKIVQKVEDDFDPSQIEILDEYDLSTLKHTQKI